MLGQKYYNINMTPTRLIMNYSNGYMLPLIQTYKYICGVCIYMYMYVVGELTYC